MGGLRARRPADVRQDLESKVRTSEDAAFSGHDIGRSGGREGQRRRRHGKEDRLDKLSEEVASKARKYLWSLAPGEERGAHGADDIANSSSIKSHRMKDHSGNVSRSLPSSSKHEVMSEGMEEDGPIMGMRIPTVTTTQKKQMQMQKQMQIQKQKKQKKQKKKKKKKKKTRKGAGDLTRGVTDKKLRAELEQSREDQVMAATAAARAEVLLTQEEGYLEAENELERTDRVSQGDIKRAVDITSARKVFDLHLPQLGPYAQCFDRSGRHMLIGGRKGHLALFDTIDMKLKCEVQAGQTVRDVCFLHDHSMWAAAQRKRVFLYDDNGVELHCLKAHIEPSHLTFLPYHFLLVTAGRSGYIKWQDTSTGRLVSSFPSRLGSPCCLRSNPHNAVSLMGHGNGTVTMWSPNMSTPLVKMACHRGPCHALACDIRGTYLATAGADERAKIWDLRSFRGPLREIRTDRPVAVGGGVDFSQRGALALGFGPHVQIWKDLLKRGEERGKEGRSKAGRREGGGRGGGREMG